MFQRFGPARHFGRRLGAGGGLAFALLGTLALGACEEVNPSASTNNNSDSFSASAPVTPVQTQPLPGAPPGPAGSGSVRVAMILPLTQASGTPSVVGVALKNAGELAASEVRQFQI